MEEIALRVKFHRSQAGLTKKQLADELDTDPSCVTRWEAGEQTPSLRMLLRICTVLGVSMHEFWAPMRRRSVAG